VASQKALLLDRVGVAYHNRRSERIKDMFVSWMHDQPSGNRPGKADDSLEVETFTHRGRCRKLGYLHNLERPWQQRHTPKQPEGDVWQQLGGAPARFWHAKLVPAPIAPAGAIGGSIDRYAPGAESFPANAPS
jgi:hypothetical protein